MYVRYKKNIQENDLPRKRVRKASKIAGSGGQQFGNKMPREGTETRSADPLKYSHKNLEIRCPERGRKPNFSFSLKYCWQHLEIRCPERGRKLLCQLIVCISVVTDLEIRCPERGRKHYILYLA